MTRESRLVFILACASLVVAIAITLFYRANNLQEVGEGSKPRIAVILKSIDYENLEFWQSVRDGIVAGRKRF